MSGTNIDVILFDCIFCVVLTQIVVLSYQHYILGVRWLFRGGTHTHPEGPSFLPYLWVPSCVNTGPDLLKERLLEKLK